MKKGIFFTIDGIIAAGIIFATIILISSVYTQEQNNYNVNYLSKDLANSLTTLKIKDSDNGYIKGLVADGTIKNKDNTVLEQIGEFWADDKLDVASKTVSNLTSSLIPVNIGFGVWIDNQQIYSKDVPLKKALVTSKMLVSGFKKGQATSSYDRQNPPTLFEPIVIEVRAWE